MRRALALAAAWMFVAGAAPAAEWQPSASIENLVTSSVDSRGRRGVTDLMRARLGLKAWHRAWFTKWVYEHALLWGAAAEDPVVRRLLAAPEPAWLDAHAELNAGRRHQWSHRLYRGLVGYDDHRIRIILGRQRIAWGSGRVWNPTDRFNPVLPTAIEPDWKLGVDALRAAWLYREYGSVEAVVAPGRARHAAPRREVLRWQDTLAGTDLALMVGTVGSERVLGLDLTRNLGDAGIRIEGMQSRQAGRNLGQWVAGIDYTWAPSWAPAGLYLAAEYFYDGMAAPVAPAAAYRDRIGGASRHQLAVLAGYDLTPLLRLDLTAIRMARPGAWFGAASLRWSALQDLDLTALFQLGGGRKGSELRGFRPVAGLRLDAYF